MKKFARSAFPLLCLLMAVLFLWASAVFNMEGKIQLGTSANFTAAIFAVLWAVAIIKNALRNPDDDNDHKPKHEG